MQRPLFTIAKMKNAGVIDNNDPALQMRFRSEFGTDLFTEAISKVSKSLKRYCLCPAKGAFSAVTATGSCLKLPLA